MNLYLIRHGDAEHSSGGTKDYDRKLSIRGIETTKKAAESWKKIIKNLDYIVSSPLTRAIETSNIIADVFQCKDKVIIDNSLTSGGNINNVIPLVNSLEVNNIALVGHMPDLAYHLSDLVCKYNFSVMFEKSSIAGIYFENKINLGKGYLEFLIPAEVL